MSKYTIKIERDEHPINPRENYDNLGTMICIPVHYGDKHNLSVEEANDIEIDKNNIWLPIYIYSHSGETISTTPFSCPWDSTRLGLIYVTKEQLRKEYNVEELTQDIIDKAHKMLQGEVETQDAYIRGDCYCYVIEDEDGEVVESCGGYLGDEDYCRKDAEDMVNYLVERDRTVRQMQVKAYIKNNVPLERRK